MAQCQAQSKSEPTSKTDEKQLKGSTEAVSEADDDDDDVTVRGIVKSFHENKEGNTDGLTLTDGKEIHFPPHLGEKIADMVSKGDEVEITGHNHTGPKGDSHVRADMVKNLKSGKSLDVKASPPPKKDGEESMTSTGVVKSFHKNPKGDLDGLTFADNSEVRFPPHMGKEIEAVIAKGDEIQVVGHKHTGPKGDTHLRADSIKNVKSGKSVDVGPLHDKDGPPHEQILTEIRAIRTLINSNSKGIQLASSKKAVGPPHEQVLLELHDLRAYLEAQSASKK